MTGPVSEIEVQIAEMMASYEQDHAHTFGEGVESARPKATSWAPVDMVDALNSEPVKPEYLRINGSDDRLFYPCKTHIVFAPSESGKTWISLHAVHQALSSGQRVAFIDHEDDARSVASRLMSLGVEKSALVDDERFRYLRPTEPVTAGKGVFAAGAVDFGRLIEWRPDLVIIDGVSEAMTEEGLDPLNNAHTAQWFGLMPRRLAEHGACVVMIDHTAKSHGDGRPSELGAQHKRSGISGASFYVDPVVRPARALGVDPVEGLLRIHLVKDRGGFLRGRYRGEWPVVADVHITSWPDDSVSVALESCEPTQKTNALLNEVVEYVYMYPGSSKSSIASGCGRDGRDKSVSDLLKQNVSDGLMVVETKGLAHAHTLTDEGVKTYSDLFETDDASSASSHVVEAVTTLDVAAVQA